MQQRNAQTEGHRDYWPARWAIWTQTAILRCSSGQRPVILLGSIPPSDLMNWLSNKTSCNTWKQRQKGSLTSLPLMSEMNCVIKCVGMHLPCSCIGSAGSICRWDIGLKDLEAAVQLERPLFSLQSDRQYSYSYHTNVARMKSKFA